jgi:hypothetical protein
MRFEEVLDVWKKGRLTQEEAALMLGVCGRTFRRYINRYDEGGLGALQDKRLIHASARAAPVDKVNLTQFGRAMHQLGIEMIPAYSPEARGRSERPFRTHQDRLVKELAAAGITTIDAANQYLKDVYKPAYNAELMEPAAEQGSCFVPVLGVNIEDILCEQHTRTVGRDNITYDDFCPWLKNPAWISGCE